MNNDEPFVATKITNVAACYDLFHWDAERMQWRPWIIPLDGVHTRLQKWGAHWDPRKFPAVRLTLRNPQADYPEEVTFLLYSSGCVVQTGCKSEQGARVDRMLLRKLIWLEWGHVIKFTHCRLTNVCSAGKLGHYVDVKRMHEEYLSLQGRSKYNPKKFPGLRFDICPSVNPSFVCTLYDTGHFNITGVVDSKDCELAENIVPLIARVFSATKEEIAMKNARKKRIASGNVQQHESDRISANLLALHAEAQQPLLLKN